MSETILAKEKERQLISRLLAGWSKLSLFTLQAYASLVKVTRANLFTQVSTPNTGKRMGIEALHRAAFGTGVVVDEHTGYWKLINGFCQQWEWKGDATDEHKESIKTYLQELHTHLRSPSPFLVSRVQIIKNRYYAMEREYALIRILDVEGNEATVQLFAETEDLLKEAARFLADTGVCKLSNEPVAITSEVAAQWAHGPAPKPQPAPSVDDVDWKAWISLIWKLHILGRRPIDIARIYGIETIETEEAPRAAPEQIKIFKDDAPDAPKENASWAW